ncbi:MAG: amidohydrolase family protein [Candidatus Uhrbacteria bacterium]|nr:amidohydrolase family protein [Candidatus Uhrbacteria bacterium]
MIVDVHVHTSNHPMVGLHTADASIEAIEREADRFGIAKALVIATYFPYKGSGVPNQEMLRRIEHRDRFAMIGSLDAMNQFGAGVAELEALAREGMLVGIKLFAGYQMFHVSHPTMFPLYELAERFQLPVTIHGGELHHCCSRERRNRRDLKCGNSFCWIDRSGALAEPAVFYHAIHSFPRVNFVIAHLANPFFDQLRHLMIDCPNVYTDTSGQFLSGTDEASSEYKQMIVEELHKFLAVPNGMDRMMFGSDFPIQSFADTIELVNMLGLSEDAKEKILWQNANRVYRLGLETRGVK